MTNMITGTSDGLVSLNMAADNPTTITASGTLTDGLSVSYTGLEVVNAGSIGAGSSVYGIDFLTAGSVTNQSGGAISGGDYGVFGQSRAVTVVNAGSITGADNGIYFQAGGSVTNQSSGAISGGYFGIDGLGGTVTVVNAGSIAGNATNSAGVLLGAGGSVTNQSGGAISGGLYGIDGESGAVTVANAGSITGSFGGVGLDAGGSVTNQSGGAISGGLGIVGQGGAVTVVNAGRIAGNATNGIGVRLSAGGTVINQSGGAISGYDGIVGYDAALTVVNAGTIASSGDAVKFAAGYANRLVVDPNAVFAGQVNGGNAIRAAQVSTLELASAGSAGTLSELGTKYVDFAQVTVDAGAQWTLAGANTLAAGTTLTNAGTLTDAGSLTNAGTLSGPLTLAPGGFLSNSSTGTITAPSGAAVYGATGGAATVVNAGVIAGGPRGGDQGIFLAGGASVTNQSGGSITGYQGIYSLGIATVVNAGSIAGTSTGVFLQEGGSVTNQSGGSITGQDGIVGAGGALTMVNAGSIVGNTTNGIGVDLSAGGSVTNQSDGSISGYDGIFGAGTVVNAGRITGGSDAVRFTAGHANRLVIDPKAVFSGTVTGGNAIGAAQVSTLELASAGSAGTLSGLGTTYVDFAQITVDAGARWTLAGANTLVAGAALTNAGTLTDAGTLINAGALSGALTLAAGGVLSNASTGTITAPSGAAVYGATGGAASVVNAGVIAGGNGGDDQGIYLADGGSVTNQSGGTISGQYGILGRGAAGTVVNAGTITGGTVAVEFASGYTNRLVIDPNAVFVGTVTGGNAIGAAQVSTLELASTGAVGTLSGFGTQFVDFAQVTVDAGAQWTLQATDTIEAGVTLTNAGTLSGPLTLAAGGVLSNATTGTVTASGGTAVFGATGGPVTVVNAGVIADIDGRGIDLAVGASITNQSGGSITGYDGIVGYNAAVTVTNAGTIAGANVAVSVGVLLFAGGSVTNQSGGAISGYDGIFGEGGAVTAVNSGSIAGDDDGIGLVVGGSVTNQSGGAISGAYGVAAGGTVTVVNAGTITGRSYAVKFAGGFADRLVIDPNAVFTGQVNGGNAIGAADVSTLELASAGSAGTLSGLGTQFVDFAQVTVDAGAQWTLVGANTIAAGYTLTNAGTIIDSGTSGLQVAGGYLLNQVGGTITNSSSTDSSGFAVYGVAGAAGSVVNFGVIAGDGPSGAGIDLAGGGSVINQSGGTIMEGVVITGEAGTVTNAGSVDGSYDGVFLGAGGSVVNQEGGTITGQGTGSIGVNVATHGGIVIAGAAGTVTNAGSVSGYHDGVFLSAGGSVTNQEGGMIAGQGTGGIAINVATNAGTVTNTGLLHGQFDGVDLGAGGSVTNQAGGTIGGGTAIASYEGGNVTNQAGGTISGQTAGIYIGFGAGTVTNAGYVYGRSLGVFITAGGSVTNQSGGMISGRFGIVTSGSAVTVVNAGTITSSSYAVKFAAEPANRLIADPGAVFTGNVEGGGGVLELASAASAGTLSGFGTSITNFGSLQFDSGAAWTISGNDSASGLGTIAITGFADNDTIDLTGFVATGDTFANNTLVLTDGGGAQDTLAIQGAFTSTSFQLSDDGNGGTDVVVCFCAGTQIGTPTGEVPVEKLTIGDRVLTAHNGPRTVKWIGHGKVLATRGRRSAATPVIVRKGALGDNVPNRDLHVTKAHALYIDDVLIPVEFLVNHRTILWDDRAQEVAIYHVELDSHDVLLANGAPAESYRDDGNRWLFHNANAGWHLPQQDTYAPVLTGGPVVDAAWRRLLDRAGPRHLPPLTDDPDLHLVVDGTRVDAEERQGPVYVFRLPPRPKRVVIASREIVPAEFGIARDSRSLGVALRQVAVRQGGKFMLFDAADERLTVGFHVYEADGHLRWTDGYAELPAEIFAWFDKAAEVMLHLGGATQYPDERVSPAQAAA